MTQIEPTIDARDNCVIVRTREDLQILRRSWAYNGESVALIPTMGAIHPGHEKLFNYANEMADRTLVSLFVNPTQFSANEDFDSYPRDEQSDFQKLAEFGVDGIFAPTIKGMYQQGFASQIVIAGPAIGLETRFRPYFFRGVATIVIKLLLQSFPEIAIFGEKDYQQLQVVRRMVTDFDIPVAIVGVPTARASDGLAHSSRNRRLTSDQRELAPLLFQCLQDTAKSILAGNGIIASTTAAEQRLLDAGFKKIDYISLCDGETLQPVKNIKDTSGTMRLLTAAWLGKTRLIDNLEIALK